jgi:hypothetical protein
MQQAVEVKALPGGSRNYFRKRLALRRRALD